jgi:hypothetical protein
MFLNLGTAFQDSIIFYPDGKASPCENTQTRGKGKGVVVLIRMIDNDKKHKYLCCVSDINPQIQHAPCLGPHSS